ncbi:hypothetical protein [Oscillatoria acuminata]|uniref:Pre-peptidase n=1 Tax=Oscillatoria acuminata PCC 6304 TaxID=56110 RepID=K9TCE6_9CYAN|nr:hypothetical protein [Oscillatoria acuminata]AFY79771.1 hypothetical protein Oscil6304_0011 [Oscillatoria acuminata PCC 6304]
MVFNLFDPEFYQANSSDLQNLDETQLREHWLNFGLDEERAFSPWVDLNVYRRNNPDLESAGLTTNRQLFEHLQSVGVSEGRQFSEQFDVAFYRNAHPDLTANGIETNEQLFEHFQTFGFEEGRPGIAPTEPIAIAPPPPVSGEILTPPPNLDPLTGSPVLASPTAPVQSSVPAPPIFPGNLTAEPPGPLPEIPPLDEPVSFEPLSPGTGDTLNADLGMALSNFNITFEDVVGAPDDLNDYYRFHLNQTSSFNGSISGSQVGLEVYRDGNQDGILQPDEVFMAGANGLSGSSDFGGPRTSVSGNLVEGTYYVRVFAANENTNYALTLSAFSDFGGPPPVA